MRRALLLCALLACARHPRAPDPLAWIELQSDHFTLRTDLGEAEAREVAGQLELVRAALIGASPWGSEAMQLSPEAGFAYESAAWVLVHYLANQRKEKFDAFLGRLGRAEDPRKAFAAEFPDLTDGKLPEEIARYVKEFSQYVRFSIEWPQIQPKAAIRAVPRPEVHALRADLLRISPGYKRTPERDAQQKSELAQALAGDPGNPLALELSESGDAENAT